MELSAARHILPLRDDAPLTRSEIRQLRRLAAVADRLLAQLRVAECGPALCPTWRRIERAAASGDY